jgi:hypothetical protein
MSDPIRAALDKAAEAARIEACKPGCCGEGTGCEVGPCHCSRVAAAAAIAAFLRALTDGAVLVLLSKAPDPYYGWRDTLADAVLAAAKDQAND